MVFNILDKELEIDLPDGFYELNEEERQKMNFFTEGGEFSCFSDPERHILVSVGKKEINAFAAMLLNSKDIAKNMEQMIEKALVPADYHFGSYRSQKNGSLGFEGFRYDYSAQGIGMTAESYAAKYKRTVYYVHIYMRSALKEESLPVTGRILESIYLRYS